MTESQIKSIVGEVMAKMQLNNSVSGMHGVYADMNTAIEKAKEADVPIHKDDKLAKTLSKLEIGEMIPPELYEVVAEILVFVDAMDKIKAKVSNYKDKK